ncbi:MAG: sigma-70 family RNA polymerase sigma factor [Planctomycetota bacterium]
MSSAELSPSTRQQLDDWFRTYGDDLLAFARRRLRDAEDAQDAVQDALVSAAEAVERGTVVQQDRAMLFTLLRRRIVDHVRRDRVRRRVAEEFAEITQARGPSIRDQVYAIARDRWVREPADAMEREEFWEAFARCLDGMPPLMRQAMVFREIDGLDTKDVCELLDLTKANLWTLVHRGRLRLRKELSNLLSQSSDT